MRVYVSMTVEYDPEDTYAEDRKLTAAGVCRLVMEGDAEILEENLTHTED